jgi:hypothetical protein
MNASLPPPFGVLFTLLSQFAPPAAEPRAQPAPLIVPLVVQQMPPAPPEPAHDLRAQIEQALKLEGDVKVVKVDKVITIKEDVTVVGSLPFTITAPPGAMIYNWQMPAGVSGMDMGERFEVTTAPKGTLTVGCRMTNLVIDWEKKTSSFSNTFLRTTFAVGAAPPPPIKPPVDPPVGPPVDPPGTPDLGPDKMGFAKLAYENALKVPGGKAKAAELADNFEGTSAKLAATGSMTPAQASGELTKLNQATLPDEASKAPWRPFFGAWEQHANGLRQNGTLTSKPAYVEAFSDTARGLRAASR